MVLINMQFFGGNGAASGKSGGGKASGGAGKSSGATERELAYAEKLEKMPKET